MDNATHALTTLRLGSNLSILHETAFTADIMPKRKRDGDSEWESASDTSEPQQHSSRRRRLVDNERINIINALHAFIQEERRTNFSFLSQHSHYHKHQNELLVVSQADADDVKVVCDSARHDTTAYNNWFTFTEPLRSDGFARTVAIDVPSGSSVAVEDLTITEFGKIKKTRRKAAAWIRDTYCTAEDDMWAMRLPEPQYEEQRLWWEGTGQAFRLLDLPLEMREAIYLHVIGPVVVPDIVTQGGAEKLVLGYGLSYDNPDRVGRNRDPNIQRPNMEIMRVSRQVKVEATQVANRDTVKRFTTIRTRGDGIGPATPPKEIWRKLGQLPTPDNFLKRLQLEMSATEFLAFGGICPQLGQPLARGVVPINVTSMARLRNLDTIDFRFIGPEHELANCPWRPLHLCQKKWIDIFFITAWNDLVTLRNTKGIKYTMSGCIKDSTRNHWTGLLNDKRNDHTASIRILEQDLQIAITNTTSLACECSNPCVGGSRLFRVQPHEMRLIDGIQAELDKAYWDFED